MKEESIMEETESGYWKKFLRKHAIMVALFIIAVVLAAVGAVLVFLWFVGNAQSTRLVPAILGLWSMRHLVTFILYVIFWELILIGIPVAIAGALGWLWWRRLPSDEKREYHFMGKGPRRASGGGGAVSLLLFIAFCIKVYIDGNWNVAIGSWTLDYVVYSILWILIWIIIIFGIPAAIAAIWWINHEMKKKT
jgi:hypothetical protein